MVRSLHERSSKRGSEAEDIWIGDLRAFKESADGYLLEVSWLRQHTPGEDGDQWRHGGAPRAEGRVGGGGEGGEEERRRGWRGGDVERVERVERLERRAEDRGEVERGKRRVEDRGEVERVERRADEVERVERKTEGRLPLVILVSTGSHWSNWTRAVESSSQDPASPGPGLPRTRSLPGPGLPRTRSSPGPGLSQDPASPRTRPPQDAVSPRTRSPPGPGLPQDPVSPRTWEVPGGQEGSFPSPALQSCCCSVDVLLRRNPAPPRGTLNHPEEPCTPQRNHLDPPEKPWTPQRNPGPPRGTLDPPEEPSGPPRGTLDHRSTQWNHHSTLGLR
ncbi:unnamed protein product [Gadus morhua 'NCC']